MDDGPRPRHLTRPEPTQLFHECPGNWRAAMPVQWKSDGDRAGPGWFLVCDEIDRVAFCPYCGERLPLE